MSMAAQMKSETCDAGVKQNKAACPVCGATEFDPCGADGKAAEPLGRQPKPVTVLLYGEPQDVQFWKRELARRAEFKDDRVQQSQFGHGFVIYPRAVND